MLAYFFHFMAERFNPLTKRAAINFPEGDLVLHDGFDKAGVMDIVRGQGFPFARILRHVGNQEMGVQLRIKIARGIMRIGGRHHLAGVYNGRNAVFRVAGRDELLHIAGRHADGMVMCFHHFFIIPNERQNGHALGSGKGQVMARAVDVLSVNLLAQP